MFHAKRDRTERSEAKAANINYVQPIAENVSPSARDRSATKTLSRMYWFLKNCIFIIILPFFEVLHFALSRLHLKRLGFNSQGCVYSTGFILFSLHRYQNRWHAESLDATSCTCSPAASTASMGCHKKAEALFTSNAILYRPCSADPRSKRPRSSASPSRR